MPMMVRRRIDRLTEQRIIREAQIKKATTTDTSQFERVASKFVAAVMKVREAMATTDTTNDYSMFFGGFEQCDALVQDPAYQASQEAQMAYQLLLGADSWLRHEASKLGEEYVPPEHFFKTWELAGYDLRGHDV